MKVYEIMQGLFSLADMRNSGKTCDTLKCGDPEKETNKVGVTMFATPEVIKQAHAWGAGLLIVHEPIYYNHFDEHSDDEIEVKKRTLLESTGMTVYRYHDHPHVAVPDMIAKGMFRAIGLNGRFECEDKGPMRLHLEEEISPRELAKLLEERLGVKHVRVAGSIDKPCKVLSGMFGASSGVDAELRSNKSEIVIAGEVREWSACEYARDAAQLGYKKAVIVMGHVPSERNGMEYIADVIKEKYPSLEVTYFESGEVFQ